MKKILTLLLVLVFIVGIFTACKPAVPATDPQTSSQSDVPPELEGVSEDVVAWLKSSELGPYASTDYDEDALYEKAKQEGKVVIYSYSSRVFKFAETFMAAFPGIEVEGFDIDPEEIVTKIQAEQQAGNLVADIIFMEGMSLAKHELLNKGYVWNYVPPNLTGVLAPEYQSPILNHHLGMEVIVYNDQVYDSPPVNNLWDLTKPEWKGRVQFPDPTKLPSYQDVLTSIVEHSDEMAAAYEQAYGEPLTLSPGIENAGYEWIYRLLNNDVVITGSNNDVVKNVGAPGQTNPPIGMTAYSRLRDKEKEELYFQAIKDMVPVMGVSHDTAILITTKAAHPNAAKLLIQWMMGDENAGQGFEPYNVIGNFPTRSDQPSPEGAYSISELKFWAPDLDYTWDNNLKVLDFWIANLD